MREHAPEPIRVDPAGHVLPLRAGHAPAREIQFHQVEGLAVGRNITFADLKGTLTAFARRMFGPQVRTRFRAVALPVHRALGRDGRGVLRVRRHGLPGVQAHRLAGDPGQRDGAPEVLRNGGYDPAQFSGFAFGMGPERITMLQARHRRHPLLLGNDLRFLEQF